MCRLIEYWLYFQANQTFSDFARGIQLSKDWEGYIESVQKHFAGSSTYDILRVSKFNFSIGAYLYCTVHAKSCMLGSFSIHESISIFYG